MIDDGLKNWSGHNAAYALSLLDEFRHRRTECTLFANARIEELGAVRADVLPVFRNFAAGLFFEWKALPSSVNRLLRFLRANWSHLRDLHSKVSPHVREEDVILVLITSSRTTLAFALWLRSLAMRNIRTKIVFILHNRPHDLFKWEARLLETIASGHQIIWAAHTEPARSACEAAVGHRSFLLPLPFGSNGIEGSSRRAPGHPVIFAYLGVAGFAKGLDLVVTAIEKVRDLLETGKLRLIIQYNVHMRNKSLEELSDRLVTLASEIPNIEIIRGPMEPAEYNRRMNESDLVLIPHRRESYRYALSGIFTEALSLGKPVIVTSGTHMAEELQHFGAGICFEDGDISAFAAAIRKAVADIQILHQRALEAGSSWRQRHNAEQYVSELVDMVNLG